MRRPARWLILVAIGLCAAAVVPQSALAERAFAPRFAANAQGDIAVAANTLVSCDLAEGQCAAARFGTATPPTQNNNSPYVMTYVDVDADPATFNSSDATLALPPGATILFAGLYYGGRRTMATGGVPVPNPAARGTVLLRAPGDAAYRTLSATQIDEASAFYQGFVDVTAIVAASGSGSYRVANAQIGTGRNDTQGGGWTLVAAYRDPVPPSRNLVVFDGLQNVGSASGGVTIPLSGFLTPLTGPVRSTIGIVALDGGPATTGDGAAVNDVRLSNAVNPLTNLFNSTISRAGVRVTTRDPAYPNTLGYDADLFATTGVLANGQTATTARLTTSGDAYTPGVVTFATDLYAPKIDPTKTVDLAAADAGDELTYTVGLANSGQDAAAAAVLTDAIPPGTTYVPDSLEVVAGANPGAKTDAAGDDQAEFDAAGNRVVVRVGAGATAGAGGVLAPGAATAVRFSVTVTPGGISEGTVVENRGRLDFAAQTTGAADVLETPVARTSIRVPVVDLTLAKTRAGGTGPLAVGAEAVFRLTVANAGTGGATGVVVTDTLPDGLTLAGAPAECTSAGQSVNCAAGAIARFDSRFFDLRVRAEPSAAGRTLTNRAAVTSAEPDVAPASNEASLDIQIGPYSVLEATKTAAAASIVAGTPATFTATVRNDGPSAASDVRLIDLLPEGLRLRSATPSQGTCAGPVCDLGGLPAGATARIELVADVDASAAGPRVNAVEVTATSPSRPGRAEAPFEVRPAGVIPPPAARPLDLVVGVRPPPRAVQGAAGAWMLEVVNNGPATATGVTLAAAVDRPVDLLGARQAQSGCGARLPVFCALGTLAAGDRRTIVLRLRPRVAGRLTLTGRVAAAEAETTPADNLGRASLTVGPGRARVSLRVTPSAASVRAGGPIAFTIALRNPGRVTARRLQVCGRPSAALAVTRSPGARLSSGRACWTLPSLPSGATRRYRVAARVLAVNAPAAAAIATVRGANIARTSARAGVRLLQRGAATPIFTG